MSRNTPRKTLYTAHKGLQKNWSRPVPKGENAHGKMVEKRRKQIAKGRLKAENGLSK